MKYRKLHSWKYALAERFATRIEIRGYEYDSPYLRLSLEGVLTFEPEYAWDGNTRAPDTRESMTPSLVHDGIYQLIDAGVFPADAIAEIRAYADTRYHDMCVQRGMWRIRARIRYRAIRAVGGFYAKPDGVDYYKVYTVP